MATERDLSRLREPFAAEDIEWRVQQAGEKNGRIWARVLAYVTNRAIMDRLDDVVGAGNWQNVFAAGPAGGVVCGLSIRITRDDGTTEWVTKWDGAENSDVEPVKGGLSNSMKRAAVQWGLGRELYTIGESWANVHEHGSLSGRTKDGKWFKWDPPSLPEWATPKPAPATSAQMVTIQALLDRVTDPRVVAAMQKRLAAGLTVETAAEAQRYLEGLTTAKAA